PCSIPPEYHNTDQTVRTVCPSGKDRSLLILLQTPYPLFFSFPVKPVSWTPDRPAARKYLPVKPRIFWMPVRWIPDAARSASALPQSEGFSHRYNQYPPVFSFSPSS